MNRHSTPEALASSSQVDNDLAKSTMSSMNSLSLTQLLEQMNACSDEGGDDNGNGGKTKPVNDNSSKHFRVGAVPLGPLVFVSGRINLTSTIC